MTKLEAGTDLKPKKTKSRDGFWGNVRVVIEAILIAVVIRTLLVQPFYIPSGSMKESLLVGDYLFINKFSYGYSRYSCPFGICPISGRIFGSEPERGDVVVFRHPVSGQTYVKRLVGLPGETIQMKNGMLYINDEAVPQAEREDFIEAMDYFAHEPGCYSRENNECRVKAYTETLPNGVEHPVLNQTDTASLDNTDAFLVPDGHYFMVGDNRDNSLDSRQVQERRGVGFVPYENLIGKASLIVFSSAGKSLFFFWEWRGDRFFKWVK